MKMFGLRNIFNIFSILFFSFSTAYPSTLFKPSLPYGWIRVTKKMLKSNNKSIPLVLIGYMNDPQYKYLAFDPGSVKKGNDAIMCVLQIPFAKNVEIIDKIRKIYFEYIQRSLTNAPNIQLVEHREFDVKGISVERVIADYSNFSNKNSPAENLRLVEYFFFDADLLTIFAYSSRLGSFKEYGEIFQNSFYKSLAK